MGLSPVAVIYKNVKPKSIRKNKRGKIKKKLVIEKLQKLKNLEKLK